MWPFEYQVSAVVRALFNGNAHWGTILLTLGGKAVHLMGQCCLIRPLKVNRVCGWLFS
jgi:hypothetical protein